MKHQKRRLTKEFLSSNFSLYFAVDSPPRRRTLNALAVEWVKRASNAIIILDCRNMRPMSDLPRFLCASICAAFKKFLRLGALHEQSEFEYQIFNHHYCFRRLCTRNYGPLQLSRSYHVAYSIANLTPECSQQ